MVVDVIYECADICEHEFDVEVELGMLGLRHHELFTVPPENNASYCFSC